MKFQRNIKQVKYYKTVTIRGQKGRGLGHVTYFLNCGTLHISGTSKATNLKLGVQIDYGEYCCDH